MAADHVRYNLNQLLSEIKTWNRLYIEIRTKMTKISNVVDPEGIEPSTLPCHGNVLPLDYGPKNQFFFFLDKTLYHLSWK